MSPNLNSYPHDLLKLRTTMHILSFFPDLACMYKLFARVDGGLQCIVKCLSAHLRETGRNLVTEEPGLEAPGRNATSYIQSLLDLRDQYNMFLERSFNNDSLFKHAIASVRTCGVHNYVWDILWCMCSFAETGCYMYIDDTHFWTHKLTYCVCQCVIIVYMTNITVLVSGF